MKALEWRDVDLAGKVVRLRPEISKNKDGRLLPLQGELLGLSNERNKTGSFPVLMYFTTMANLSGTFGRSWKRRLQTSRIRSGYSS